MVFNSYASNQGALNSAYKNFYLHTKKLTQT